MIKKGFVKLLSFESWVTRWEWYNFAKNNPEKVPYFLVDRSPCTDPFFDPFAQYRWERRPIISGLCRCLKNFEIGERFIYITRIDPFVCADLGINLKPGEKRYFGVACLSVKQIYESHQTAASYFLERRYNVAPILTPYPPNIAHEARKPSPVAAVERRCCVVFDKKRKSYTPYSSDDTIWKEHCHQYFLRQKNRKLRVAECQVENVDSKESLNLDVHTAPVFSEKDWGGKQMNVQGIWVSEDIASNLRSTIAATK